jgi:hypothetical protein
MNKDRNVREGEDENGRKSKGTNFGGTKSYKRTAAGRRGWGGFHHRFIVD